MTIWTSSGLNAELTGLEWGVFSGLLVISYLVLLILGIAYNTLIAWMETKGYLEGYVSFSVAIGVFMTLAIVYFPQSILSIFVTICLPIWAWILITLVAFVFSGTPMIVGSVIRYLKSRTASIKAMKREAGSYD